MNDLQTDNLFREKLEQFSAKPGAASWEKLNSLLEDKKKTKKGSFWFIAASIAASITIIAVVITQFGPTPLEMSGVVTVENEPVIEKQPGPNEQLETTGVVSLNNTDKPNNDKEQIEVAEKSADIKKIAIIRFENNEPVVNEKYEDIMTQVAVISIDRQDLQMSSIASHGFQLSMSLKAIPVIDLEYEEASKFKRAYDYAVRVKNGEQNLFDLRKAKNDLFAKAKNVKLTSQSTLD